MIHPYNTPCPKCGRTGQSARYEPAFTKEAYQRRYASYQNHPDLAAPPPKPPNEEHLVRKCECGAVFWTRTADYQEPQTPAYDELKAVLETAGYHEQRIAVVSDDLHSRLRKETHDPFGTPGGRQVLWYQNWTMIMPASRVLDARQSQERQPSSNP